MEDQRILLLTGETGFCEWGRVDAFLNSEQNMLADGLLKAYRENDGEEVMYVVKSSKVIPHLDHMVRHNFVVYLLV